MLNIQTGIRNAVGRGHSRSTVTAPKSPLVIDGNVKNSPASAASTPKYLYYYFIIIIFNINKINNIKINIFMFYYQSLLLFKVFTFSFSPCFFLFSHCMVLCWHIQDLPLSFLVPAILITSKSFTLLQKFWIFHSMFHSYPKKINNSFVFITTTERDPPTQYHTIQDHSSLKIIALMLLDFWDIVSALILPITWYIYKITLYYFISKANNR